MKTAPLTGENLMRVAQFNSFLPVGRAFLTSLPGRGIELWARHPADLTPARMGTRWHVGMAGSPTWTDATECRCMVEGA